MSCYICARESVSSSPAGVCDECKRFACGLPSQRRDGIYHGEICQCRCRKFICRLDMADHAMYEHGSDPTKCFPEYTLLTSASILSAAERVEWKKKDAFDAAASYIDDFVTGVQLGRRRLQQLQLTQFFDKTTLGEEETFVVNRAFLQYGNGLTRFASLAARAMANVHASHHLGIIALELMPSQRESFNIILDRHWSANRAFRLPMMRLPSSPMVTSLRHRLPSAEFVSRLEPAPAFYEQTDVVEWLFEGSGAVGA